MSSTETRGSFLEKHPESIYLITGAVAITLSFVFYSRAPSPINENSARNMISTLVESEAAIIAVVITLSLVAVQLTASSYSPKVTEIIIRKKFHLWLLMFLYISAICICVVALKWIDGSPEPAFTSDTEKQITVLKMVDGSPEPAFTSDTEKQIAVLTIVEETSRASFEGFIRFSYIFAVLCFTALIPYTYNMFIMLKPTKIIEELSHGIIKNKILNKEDPIQPIIDIVRKSITKYDYETARDGLVTIKDKISDIFEKEDQNEEKEEISKEIFGHLSRVGRFAVGRGDEGSTIEVIKNIDILSKKIIEKELKMAAYWATVSLGKVGEAAAEKQFEIAADKASGSLENIGKTAAEKELKMAAHWAVESLREIGKTAAKKKLGLTAQKAVESLREIGKTAAKKRLEMAAYWTIESLREIGEAAAERELRMAAYWTIESLREIGEAAAKEKLEMAAHKTTESLREIGKAAIKKGSKLIAEWVAESLGKVGYAIAKEKLEKAAHKGVESLAEIGEAAAERKLENATKKTVEYLEKIAELERLEEVASVAQRSVREIRKILNKTKDGTRVINLISIPRGPVA